MPKNTPAQHFRDLFNRFIAGSTEHERAEGEKKMDAWLRRHGEKRIDIQRILAKAAADTAARQSQTAQSDPRDAQPHPFGNPQYTPFGLVHGIVGKYLTMDWYVQVIYSLWIVFSHIYPQFEIAPRLVMVSEGRTRARAPRARSRHILCSGPMRKRSAPLRQSANILIKVRGRSCSMNSTISMRMRGGNC